MSRRLFVDTAVLVYAVGGQHVERPACRELLRRAADGEVDMHISVEALQEFLFHRLRRTDRGRAVAQTRDVAELCVVHAFDQAVAVRMIDLVASSPLGGRDAVHAATALLAGFDVIISPDQDFDEAPGLGRLSPAEVVRTP